MHFNIFLIFAGADPDVISSTDTEEDSSDPEPEEEEEDPVEEEEEEDPGEEEVEEEEEHQLAVEAEGSAGDESHHSDVTADGSQSQYIDSTSLHEDKYRWESPLVFNSFTKIQPRRYFICHHVLRCPRSQRPEIQEYLKMKRPWQLPKHHEQSIKLKPIFHLACLGRVGADNAIHFALEAFQMFFSPTKISNLKIKKAKQSNRNLNRSHFD